MRPDVNNLVQVKTILYKHVNYLKNVSLVNWPFRVGIDFLEL